MTKALSQRETQVLALARAGHSTKEIASELGISTSTVNWHRKLALARQTATPPRGGEPQTYPRGKFRA